MFPRRSLLAAALIAVGVTATACGSDATDTPSATPETHTFYLDEWSVTPPMEGLSAGTVEVTVSNKGYETHELVIVRASTAAPLPTNTDGSVNEDSIAESDKVGEIADLAAGTSATATFDLPAGNYVAFCNLVEAMGNSGMGMGNGGMGNGGMGNGGMEHVHYQLGMVTNFAVS